MAWSARYCKSGKHLLRQKQHTAWLVHEGGRTHCHIVHDGEEERKIMGGKWTPVGLEPTQCSVECGVECVLDDSYWYSYGGEFRQYSREVV